MYYEINKIECPQFPGETHAKKVFIHSIIEGVFVKVHALHASISTSPRANNTRKNFAEEKEGAVRRGF